MQLSVVVFLVIASTAVLVTGYPAGEDLEAAAQSSPQQVQTLVRDKRTIGVLRDLFPNFSQIIDRKIQMLTRVIFRIVGRLILQGPNRGGGGGGGDDGDDERRIQITLPTYPPDELDDEDEDSTDSTTSGDHSETTTNSDNENSLGESKKRETRSKRDADEQAAEEEEDLEPDATGDNEVSPDNEADADGDSDEDPRNKRFLNFNLGATAGGAAGGSAGGSGNFLFDIIRRSADRAARMAGTVFRVLAGTDDAGLPSYNQQRSLVAGSGNAQSGDGTNAAQEVVKDDGVGVPGPLTRLFVVANKGVAALIQDLILRLAQTSERIVNFKARLITSII